MKMIEAFKQEMRKSLIETEQNKNKIQELEENTNQKL